MFEKWPLSMTECTFKVNGYVFCCSRIVNMIDEHEDAFLINNIYLNEKSVFDNWDKAKLWMLKYADNRAVERP